MTKPIGADAYNTSGSMYYHHRDYDRAIADFTQAIEVSGGDASASYFMRGQAYFGKWDFDSAIADFSEALRLHPDFYDAYVYRASSYIERAGRYPDPERGDYDMALPDLNEAIRLKPERGEAYTPRGLVYREKRDYKKAIADFNRGLEFSPGDVLAHFNRGLSYMYSADYKRAFVDFNETIRLKPDSTNRARSRTRLRVHDRANEEQKGTYPAACRGRPPQAAGAGLALRYNTLCFADAYACRGFTCYMADDYDNAIADFTEAIRLAPGEVNSYVTRGKLYHNRREYDKAIADFEAGLGITPHDPEIKKLLKITIRQSRAEGAARRGRRDKEGGNE